LERTVGETEGSVLRLLLFRLRDHGVDRDVVQVGLVDRQRGVLKRRSGLDTKAHLEELAIPQHTWRVDGESRAASFGAVLGVLEAAIDAGGGCPDNGAQKQGREQPA